MLAPHSTGAAALGSGHDPAPCSGLSGGQTAGTPPSRLQRMLAESRQEPGSTANGAESWFIYTMALTALGPIWGHRSVCCLPPPAPHPLTPIPRSVPAASKSQTEPGRAMEFQIHPSRLHISLTGTDPPIHGNLLLQAGAWPGTTRPG